jgi:hypothetical protein
MEKDIGKIKKNDFTDIIVRIDDFGGKRGLTIREFTTGERYTGFTKSGTRIPAESIKEFKDIINSIDESDLKQPEQKVEEKLKKEPEQKTIAPDDAPAEEPKPKKKKKKDVVQEEVF